MYDTPQLPTKSVESFGINYSKASAKKHKTYQNDGTFEVNGNRGKILDEDGATLFFGTITSDCYSSLNNLSPFTFNDFDIRPFDSPKSRAEDEAAPQYAPVPVYSVPTRKRPLLNVPPNYNYNGNNTTFSSANSKTSTTPSSRTHPTNSIVATAPPRSAPTAPPVSAPSFASTSKVITNPAPPKTDEGCFVIQKPSKNYPNGVRIASVLAKVMRDHQKEGVTFLFNVLHVSFLY